MNKDAYVNELLILLKNGGVGAQTSTADAERILESSATRILRSLVRFKEKMWKSGTCQDPSELRLSRLCRQVIEIIDLRSGVRGAGLELPRVLSRMLCEEKLVEVPDGVVENTEITLKAVRYEQEIVDTAEKWVCGIRAIHAQAAHVTANLYEEKMFWISFHKQLDALCDLSLSDEYTFMIKLLQRIGRIRLYYTLETLLKDHRLLRLAECFNSALQDLDLSFIDREMQNDCSIQNIADSEDVSPDGPDNLDHGSPMTTKSCIDSDHPDSPGFVEQCLDIIDKLMDFPKWPRVVQRSICRHMGSLRHLILRHSLFHFTPSLYELFSQFNALTSNLSLVFETELHDLSSCGFDPADGVDVYLGILKQIEVGHALLKIAHKRVVPETYSGLVQLVRSYEAAFRSSIACELGVGGRPQSQASPPASTPICCTEQYQKTISELAGIFVSRSTPDLATIHAHYSMFRRLFEHQTFRDAVKDHVGSAARVLDAIALEMPSGLYFEEVSDRLRSSKDCEAAFAMAKLLSMTEHVLVCFEGCPGYKSLKGHLEMVRSRLTAYLDSLGDSLCDSTVFMRENSADNVCSAVCGFVLNRSSLFSIRKIMSRIDDLVFHRKLRSLCMDLNQFGGFFDKLHRILGGYREMTQADPTIFTDETLESYILSLDALKWKHFQESRLVEALESFESLEHRFETYSRSLESLAKIHIPRIIDEGRELTLESLCRYVAADIPGAKAIAALRARADIILDACLSHLLSRLQGRIGVRLRVKAHNGTILLPEDNTELCVDSLLRHILASMRLDKDLDPSSSRIFQDLHSFVQAQVENLVAAAKACEFSIEDTPDSLEDIARYYLDLDQKFKAAELLSSNQIKWLEIESKYKFSAAEREQWIQGLCQAVDACVFSMAMDLQGIVSEDTVGMYENHFRIHKIVGMTKCFFATAGTTDLVKRTVLCGISAPHTQAIMDFFSQQLGMVMKGTSQDASIRSRMGMIYGIKPKSTLSRKEHAQVEQRRKELCRRIGEMTESFNYFDHDEFDFAPALEELVVSKRQLCRDLDVFNTFLAHYRFADVSFDLPVEHLRKEHRIYMQKRHYLDEFLERPVIGNRICFDQLSSGLGASFRSKLLKDFCIYVCSTKTPLEYVSKLNSLERPSHFDSSMSLREYLDTFDEKKVRSAISKSVSEQEISKYLDGFHLDIASRFRYEASQGMQFVANVEEAQEVLGQAVEDHELVVKFNMHRFFVCELDEVRSRLAQQQQLLTAIRDVQDGMFSIFNVFPSTRMPEESTKFARVKAAFETLVSYIALNLPLSEDRIDSSIKACKEALCILDSINSAIKAICDECRRQSSRLHFISDRDIVRMMNERLYICEVIKTIFNVESVIMEESKIVGIASIPDASSLGGSHPKADKIVLVDPVGLDGQIHSIVNLFEASLRSTLEVYFELCICENTAAASRIGSISIIDELVAELRHFEYGSEAPYRIQRVMEYSRMLVDLPSVYPKPVFSNGKLLVGHFEYMFEYYPPTSFVFTFLTAKVFSAVVLSLKKSGLILYGPSGTGKTESVRYFCRTIGVPLYTFCCNERCDASTIISIIVGCSRAGSYMCLDEFNMLRKEVMSAVTECIFDHRDRIKMFLTMNLGYKGRFELPKSLRRIFGEIEVGQPDIKDVILYHTGSYGIFEAISELQKRCSCDPHYDFGMRAVRFILSGCLKDITSRFACFYMAALKKRDREVLLEVLESKLGVSRSLDMSYENILRVGIQSVSGIIISGGRGKSTLISSVAVANRAKIFRYNPSNLLLTNDSVFGSINPLTREWRDSTFLRDLRSSLHADQDREMPSEVWFVLDGPIRTEWIEDFNSILDDNRVICIRGERIKVPFSFKFVFECAHVDDVTPATLTRVLHISLPEGGPEHSVDIIDNDTEQHVDVGDGIVPDEVQCRAATQIKTMLEKHNVVFLRGPEGVGKKFVAKHLLGMPVRVFYSGRILDCIRSAGCHSMGEVVYVEEFHRSSIPVQEQVRELGEFGRIGECTAKNLKIICGLDEESAGMCSRMRRFPSIELREPKNIEAIVRHCMSGKLEKGVEDVCIKFYLFIHNSYCMSIRQLLSFAGCVDESLCTSQQAGISCPDDLISHVYFIFSVFFGERGAARMYLEKISAVRIRDLRFNLESLEFEDVKEASDDFLGLSRKESAIAFLLYRNRNIVVRGPRLSGKRRLVDQCMAKLRKAKIDTMDDVEILSWAEKDRIGNITSLSSQYVLVLDCQVKISEKFVRESAIEVRMDDVPLVLDTGRLLDGRTLEDSIGASDGDVNAPSALCNVTIDVDDTIDVSKSHPDACIHPRCVSFPNLYKMADFYTIFNVLREKFAQEFESRRRFLQTGLRSIDLFRKKASDLQDRIQRASEHLDGENRELERTIRLLDEERRGACQEENEVRSQRDRIHEEVARNERKRAMVNRRLDEAEKAVEESRGSIALISKNQVSEIKSMGNPPELVRRTMECVYYLLENAQGKVEWTTLQGYLRRDDFVSRVLSVSPETSSGIFISEGIERLFKSPDFSFERVCKASKACGAFHRWISSLIRYRDVCREVKPLKNDLDVLEKEVAEQIRNLDAKEGHLARLKKRVCEVEYSLESSREESMARALEIRNLLSDLEMLKEVISRLERESKSWRHLQFICPLSYMLQNKHVLEYGRCIYVSSAADHGSEESTRFSDMRRECIEVTLGDRNFKKAVSNAICYGSSILIRDADVFDPTIYSLLKHRIGSHDSARVVLQGNTNCYMHETYLHTVLPRLSSSRNSPLHAYENELLGILSRPSHDLKTILQHQDLIEEERRRLEEDERLRMLYNAINRKYAEVNARFTKSYQCMLSFEVFREFVAKNNLLSISDKNLICERVDGFFAHSFHGIEGAPFDVKEVSRYRFDYIFVTSFSDILFHLHSIIHFDVEISAGSPETNTRILDLLSERGNKVVLVKNTEFLPRCTKSGTNRFIFIIGLQEHHPLLGHARVVCPDRRHSFETIYTSLAHAFDVGTGTDTLVRFHSVLVGMGLDFSSKDLEICIENAGLSIDFLAEIVYFSRMTREERDRARAEVERRGIVGHQ